jgi:hypothetical protein
VTWDQCGPGCDYWVAVATVQPAQPSYECKPDWNSRDPNILTIWSSGAQPNGATASFDFASVEILNGVVGQRVCISIAEPYRSENHALGFSEPGTMLTVPGPGTAVAPTEAAQPCERAKGQVVWLTFRFRKAIQAHKAKLAQRLNKELKRAKRKRDEKC